MTRLIVVDDNHESRQKIIAELKAGDLVNVAKTIPFPFGACSAVAGPVYAGGTGHEVTAPGPAVE